MSVDTKRQTAKEIGVRYVKHLGNREHLIYNPAPLYGGAYEVWRTDKRTAGFGLRYKNTALRFERPAVARLYRG